MVRLSVLAAASLIVSLCALGLSVYAVIRPISTEEPASGGFASFIVDASDFVIQPKYIILSVENSGTGDARNVRVTVNLIGSEHRFFQDWIPLIEKSHRNGVVFQFGSDDMDSAAGQSQSDYIVGVGVTSEGARAGTSYLFYFRVQYPYTEAVVFNF